MKAHIARWHLILLGDMPIYGHDNTYFKLQIWFYENEETLVFSIMKNRAENVRHSNISNDIFLQCFYALIIIDVVVEPLNE